jgi:hypothetical protein
MLDVQLYSQEQSDLCGLWEGVSCWRDVSWFFNSFTWGWEVETSFNHWQFLLYDVMLIFVVPVEHNGMFCHQVDSW